MNFLPALALFSVVALIGYNAWSYYHATGTFAQRIAAAWKGSMTIFTLIWGAIISFVTTSLDTLATVTGDPQFKTIADGITKLVTPQVQQVLAVALPMLVLPALAIWARHRTLGK